MLLKDFVVKYTGKWVTVHHGAVRERIDVQSNYNRIRLYYGCQVDHFGPAADGLHVWLTF